MITNLSKEIQHQCMQAVINNFGSEDDDQYQYIEIQDSINYLLSNVRILDDIFNKKTDILNLNK